jgi:putative PIG3 family NAD(P)H quinone oxidoreductase
MRAVVVGTPGGPERLSVEEVPDPQLRAGEVLLDVVAAGVNRADIVQRQGHYPPPEGASPYLGLECSGTVAALGDGVAGWEVGQPVCALLSGGGYAERVAVPAGQLLPVPVGVSLREAAALPEVTCTVWSTVFDRGALSPGEVLLVHGGGSGIGTMAIQLARRFGATVAVTAGSAAKLEFCRELGADIAINYRTEDFVARLREETGGHGADVVLDNMGAAYLGRNVEALATDGRLLFLGMQGGVRGELDLGTLMRVRGSVSSASLRARSAPDKAAIVAATQAAVWPALESGEVRPIVDRVFALADVADAHRYLESNRHVGKVLLALGWQDRAHD